MGKYVIGKYVDVLVKALLIDLAAVVLISAFFITEDIVLRQYDSDLLDGKGRVEMGIKEEYICMGFKRDWYCNLEDVIKQAFIMIILVVLVVFFPITGLNPLSIANYIFVILLFYYFIRKDLKAGKNNSNPARVP